MAKAITLLLLSLFFATEAVAQTVPGNAARQTCQNAQNMTPQMANQCERVANPPPLFEKVPNGQSTESELRARKCIPIGPDRTEWGCPPS